MRQHTKTHAAGHLLHSSPHCDLDLTPASSCPPSPSGSPASIARVVCEVARDEHPEDRYAKAQEVAAVLYGTTRGKPNATNSMVHDVLTEIDLLTERDLEQVTEHPPLPWDEAVDGPQGQERVAT